MTLDRAAPEEWGRAVHVGYHIQTGAILGPWFPVALPIWFQRSGSINKTECPILKDGSQKKEIPPTMTEKP